MFPAKWLWMATIIIIFVIEKYNKFKLFFDVFVYWDYFEDSHSEANRIVGVYKDLENHVDIQIKKTENNFTMHPVYFSIRLKDEFYIPQYEYYIQIFEFKFG